MSSDSGGWFYVICLTVICILIGTGIYTYYMNPEIAGGKKEEVQIPCTITNLYEVEYVRDRGSTYYYTGNTVWHFGSGKEAVSDYYAVLTDAECSYRFKLDGATYGTLVEGQEVVIRAVTLYNEDGRAYKCVFYLGNEQIYYDVKLDYVMSE